jgi:transposase InsO family protein
MYRILDDNGEVRERRQQLSHPVYQKPELLAETPNEIWSWDITKLMGPTKWSYFYLYVVLDIYSAVSSAGTWAMPKAQAVRAAVQGCHGETRRSARPAHTSRRSRRADEGKSHRVPTRGPGRDPLA